MKKLRGSMRLARCALSAVCAFLYLKLSTVKSPVLCFLVFAVYRFSISYMGRSRRTRGDRAVLAIIAALFSIMIVARNHVVFTGGVVGTLSQNYVVDPGWSDLLYILLLWAVLYSFFDGLAYWLPEALGRIPRGQADGAGNPFPMLFPVVMLTMLAIWTLGYLCFFPGTMVWNDILYVLQNPQTAADISPVVFNFIVNLFLKWGVAIGKPNVGFALYCVLQMVLLSALLAYTVCWLMRTGLPSFAPIAVWMFYAFYPLISLYSFTIIRDIGYSAFMLLWLIFLYDLLSGRELKRGMVLLYAVLLVGTIVSRSNGKIVAPLMAVTVPLFIRDNRVKLFGIGILACALTFVLTGFATRNVESRSVEALGIPMQQIAMVVNEGGELSEEDREVIFSLLPESEWTGGDYPTTYIPMTVDMLKGNGQFNGSYLNSHRAEFIRTYLNVLVHNPWQCIKAYMLETYGFWAWGSVDDAQAYHMGIQESEFGFNQSPVLKGALYDFITGIYYRAIPHSEGSAATFTWLIIGTLGLLFVSGKRKYCLLLLPMLYNWLTIMVAAPIAFAFRYVFYYLLTFPVVISLLLILYRGNNQKRGVSFHGQDCGSNPLL